MNKATEQSRQLKRLMDAVKGRPLSWSLAIDLEKITGKRYSGGDKLRSAGDREKVSAVIDQMLAQGIMPSKTLLTSCQRRSQRRTA